MSTAEKVRAEAQTLKQELVLAEETEKTPAGEGETPLWSESRVFSEEGSLQ